MDLWHEQQIADSPYDLKVYLAYIDHARNSSNSIRYIIYEKALSKLPGSYKLWKMYLHDRVLSLRGRRITDTRYNLVIKCFEASLVYMNRMPIIWLEYCKLMMNTNKER